MNKIIVIVSDGKSKKIEVIPMAYVTGIIKSSNRPSILENTNMQSPQ